MAEIKSDGVFQGDLVSFLTKAVTLANEIKTDHNGMLAKLDADGGVTGTDYESLHATDAASLSLTVGLDILRSDGIHQGDLDIFLDNLITLANELKTDHNAVLAKLDADTGVTDTNYASLHTTAAAALSAPNITGTGIDWVDVFTLISAALTLLNELKADHNGVTSKLDADTLVADTNYNALHAVAAADLSLTQ